MKTFSTLLLITFLAINFSSCKKSSNNNNTPANGSMTAKVDGVSWNADLAVQATLNSGVLAIGGTGSQGQINLTIGNYTGPATYTVSISNPSMSMIYTLTSSPFTSYSATAVLGTGTVTVSSLSGGFVEGTFRFSGKNNSSATILTKEITEGTFRATL